METSLASSRSAGCTPRREATRRVSLAPAAPFLLMVAFCLPSCAIVQTTDHEGATRTQFAFGPILNVGGESDAAIGNVRSFGASKTPLGFALGYSRQSFVIDSERCRLVVWIDNDVEATALMESLSGIDNVCVHNTTRSNSNE